jgi:hypothetical protein
MLLTLLGKDKRNLRGQELIFACGLRVSEKGGEYSILSIHPLDGHVLPEVAEINAMR